MMNTLFAVGRRCVACLPGSARLLPLYDRVTDKLGHGSFGHHVLVMLTGTVMGQLISVLLSPVLTRLYTPAEFGTLGSITSIVTILSVVAILRLELALPLAHERKDAANLLALCGVALVLTALVTTLVLALMPFWPALAALFHDIMPYRWFIPLGMFAVGAYQIMVFLATREHEFKVLARTKLYQGLAGPFSQIGFGLLGAGPIGLITGYIIGQSVGVGSLFTRLVHRAGFLADGLSWAGMREMLRRYRHFPLISSPTALLSMLASSSSVMVIVSVLFSPTVAGYMFLTDRIVARPLLMLTTSIMQVYSGDISRNLRENPAIVRRRFLGISATMFGIVAFWLTVVNLLAPLCFGAVFGAAWAPVIPFLQALSVGYLLQFTLHGLGHTLQLLERQGLSLFSEIGRSLGVALVFGAAWHYSLSPVVTLLLYALVQALACSVQWMMMLHAVNAVHRRAENAY